MLSRILSMARSSANRTPLPVLGLCCTVCDLARRPQAQPLLCIPDRLEIGNLRILLTVKSEDEWHLVQALSLKEHINEKSPVNQQTAVASSAFLAFAIRGRPFHVSRLPILNEPERSSKAFGNGYIEVTVIHERPARIQELSWRPVRFFPGDTDPVEQVSFSFYNGQLFRMVVDYDTDKTNGLTSEDIIEAVSAEYGAPTKPGVSVVLASQFSDETVQVVAPWEDLEYSFNFVQLPYGSTFKLLIFAKQLNALADAALAEGIRLDGQEAPQWQGIKEQETRVRQNPACE